ncbi:hypothetical protein PNOK_0923300 [Pyrrhoderma noxium]|uniref:Uncharacterized protein n=1 Tax=Pyrrhoderma noxium TaxID=2282107 RepID=A0A286U7F7_9AGAM|nr:hypothetical protein PNOK_0923300 [Pyrrhoderma noxium]
MSSAPPIIPFFFSRILSPFLYDSITPTFRAEFSPVTLRLIKIKKRVSILSLFAGTLIISSWGNIVGIFSYKFTSDIILRGQ